MRYTRLMRIASLALGFAGLTLVASLATAQPSGPAAKQVGPPPAPSRGQERATNLQVLPRDIPHERLIAIMRNFTASVAGSTGQRCGFCHVPGNFASDANPHKNVARGMMRMTARINGELLPPIVGASDAMRVTCYSCHRGAPEPATEAPAAAPAANAPQPAPAGQVPHEHH